MLLHNATMLKRSEFSMLAATDCCTSSEARIPARYNTSPPDSRTIFGFEVLPRHEHLDGLRHEVATREPFALSYKEVGPVPSLESQRRCVCCSASLLLLCLLLLCLLRLALPYWLPAAYHLAGIDEALAVHKDHIQLYVQSIRG